MAKSISKRLRLLTILLSVVVFCGCDKGSKGSSGGGNNNGVKVTTNTPRDITANTAVLGGTTELADDVVLTEVGVCWDTISHPTVNCNHLSSQNWNYNPFEFIANGLKPEKKYYVRAYALYENKYYYGNERSFITMSGPAIPTGALSGRFSVNEYQQVYFSQGNLQYQASTNTWKFADKQWEHMGYDNENISPVYDGWIDLFGWGTGNNPTNSSGYNGDYASYSEWGYNAISNGGNEVNQWRTLLISEWNYIFSGRNTASSVRYAHACVNGVNGMILLPDDWDVNYASLSHVNDDGEFDYNVITEREWYNHFESHGAVFLPASGDRGNLGGTLIDHLGTGGYYWSSTAGGVYTARRLYFSTTTLYYNDRNRYFGGAVRLVRIAR